MEPVVLHNEVAINLGAPRFDSGHINPEFLRYNEVVNPSWNIRYPVVIESGLRIISFSNGLSVTALEDSLVISQAGFPLGVDEVISPYVAVKYLEVAPLGVEWEDVVLDFRGTILFEGKGIDPRYSPINDFARNTLSNDAIADVQIRTVYRFPDKSVTVYFAESKDESGQFITGLVFSGHVQYLIDRELSPAGRKELIGAVVNQWKQDISDFDNLAIHLYLKYLATGE